MSESTELARGRSPVDMTLSLDEGGELPLENLVTGRGFCCGKSGSGKSNTASVVAEALLRRGIPCFIVDTDGEYVSLTSEFEVLHAGSGQDCDVEIATEADAHELARTAVVDSVPVVFDISEFFDEDHAHELVGDVARELFRLEKREQTPLLMLLEECHEYLPNKGGGDVADVLSTVAKRGRKRGLGVLGLSQRPADVDTTFITQADWVVWHRLTWKNDTKVVADVLSREHADAVTELDDGEAYIMADWSDESVARAQWPRKESPDLGATPAVADAVGTAGEVSRDVLARFGASTTDESDAGDETDVATCSDCPFCRAGLEPPTHVEEAIDAKNANVLRVCSVYDTIHGSTRINLRGPTLDELGLEAGDTVSVGVEADAVRLYLDDSGLYEHTVAGCGRELTLSGVALELLAVTGADHVRLIDRGGKLYLERVSDREDARPYPVLARKEPNTSQTDDARANAVLLPTAVARYLGVEDRVGVRHDDGDVYLTHPDETELSYVVVDECPNIGKKGLKPLEATEGDTIVARPAGDEVRLTLSGDGR